MKRLSYTKAPILLAKKNAFPYQAQAVESIRELSYAAIFHEQGLGKTKIAIDLLLYWFKNTDIDSVMIVTKKQLVQNWINEFKSHTSITPVVVDSNRSNNYYSFISPAVVMLTHFEAVVSEKERIKLFLGTRNVAIIIDESAKLKNPNTKLTQTFFELSPYFKKRVIMTGTPVANRPYDIWAQIFFLDHGNSLGLDYEDFKRQTDLSNKLYSDTDRQVQFENSVADVYRKVSAFSVRETKNSGIIHLPQKVFIREEAEFNNAQLDLYERIRKELLVEVVKNGELIEDDSTFVIKRLLRLVQIASNPKLVDESYRGKSAKESVLNRLISEIISAGEKCIVWTNYIENVNSFCKEYSDFGSVKIHGGMKIADRNKSVERFRSDNIKILFATPASAKEGLTLTMANHVIFYDRGFSLDDYLQAQDRIHRISQTKTCYIHNIILKDSIDEWIDVLLQSKQKAANLAQGDISLEEYRQEADYSFGALVKEILGFEEVEEPNE